MKPTQLLMDEHRVIEQVLNCLEKMMEQCRSKDLLDTADVEDAIDFFKEFADRRHHGKEEDQLFPVMEARGFSRDTGPTGVMLHEHDEGRSYVRGMKVAVETFNNGNEKEGRFKFVNSASRFIALLRDHILKEDHCLFPMADQALNPEDIQDLDAKFIHVDKQELGETHLSKYLEIAERLAQKYEVESQAAKTNSFGAYSAQIK